MDLTSLPGLQTCLFGLNSFVFGMTETKPHEHCWTTSCNDEAAHMTPTRVAKLYNTDKIDGPEAKAEPDSFDFKLFS